MSPFPHSPSTRHEPHPVGSAEPGTSPTAGPHQVSSRRPGGTDSRRLVTAAREAAAVDAKTAAAAAADGGQGATDHLGRLLDSVPVIEQAKGLLMGYYGLAPDRAYQLLRRWSQHTNLKLSQLAELLVQSVSRPAPPGPRPSGGPPFAALQAVLTSLGSTLPAGDTGLPPGT